MQPTTEPNPQPIFNLLGLKLPVRSTLAIIITTTLLLIDYYYNCASNFINTSTMPEILRASAYDHLVIYLLVPLLVIVLIFRRHPADYGFRLGDWRAGIKWTLIIWAIAAPILYFAGQTPDMQAYYTQYFADPLDMLTTAALELVGWEFFFRGFLLWSLYEVAGPSAVILQAVPFAMAHISKPPLETLSTIFGGMMFGWVAWRTRSFIYPFLIHLFISTFTIFVSVSW
ncbi:MAG: CPBP family intramembrane metalloprotease [Anaerolineae bacterium]|nr:CPBP family intramembrane metalloprotease [Anaerolineae bacterium]